MAPARGDARRGPRRGLVRRVDALRRARGRVQRSEHRGRVDRRDQPRAAARVDGRGRHGACALAIPWNAANLRQYGAARPCGVGLQLPPGRVRRHRTPAATTRPREAPPSGRLSISTRPSGARVEVDGRNRGASPRRSPACLTGATPSGCPRRLHGRGAARHLVGAQPRAERRCHLRRDGTRTTSARAPAGRAERRVRGSVGRGIPAGGREGVRGWTQRWGDAADAVPRCASGRTSCAWSMTGYKRWSTSIRVVAGERVRVAASLEEEPPR